jgi:predicted MFS family arabinose efflux permease
MAGSAKVVAAQNRWLVLGLIWLAFIIHGIDRSVLLVLLEPIRKTFDLNDSELGLLIGLGYALPFALAGIPLGAMVDRVPKRKYFLAGLLVLWSGLTSLGGLAPSFFLLVLSRACVGASESGAPPAMMSILSDSFDAKTRPAALSVYYTAPFLGLMLGAIMAGRISQFYGWRDAVLAIGIPGMLMAVVIMIFLREPSRGRFDPLPAMGAAVKPVAPLQALRHAFRTPALRQIIIAITLAGFVVAAISGWTPVLMERVFGYSQQRTGSMLALIAGFPAVLGLLAGGAAMSLFGRESVPRLLRFCGTVLLIGTPMVAAAPLCGSARITLTLLFGWSFLSASYFGSAWSVLISTIPPAMRGTILGLTIVMSNLMGPGFGPQLAGLLSDALSHFNDPAHLQHAMACLGLITLAPALLFMKLQRNWKTSEKIESLMQATRHLKTEENVIMPP